MPLSSLQRLMLGAAVAAATVVSMPAQAGYHGLVIFGDSLSDSGNNYIALGPATAPYPPITPNAAIADNGFIPSLPYLGAPIPAYSNGPVWATSFAASLGLAPFAAPSLLGGGNFAFGGAVIAQRRGLAGEDHGLLARAGAAADDGVQQHADAEIAPDGLHRPLPGDPLGRKICAHELPVELLNIGRQLMGIV